MPAGRGGLALVSTLGYSPVEIGSSWLILCVRCVVCWVLVAVSAWRLLNGLPREICRPHVVPGYLGTLVLWYLVT